MAYKKLSLGGTPVLNFHQCEGSPQLTQAPYGHPALTARSPHLDAHLDGVLVTPNYNISYPLKPADLEVQRNNLDYGEPLKAGDNILLTYIPTNHLLDAIRIDVAQPDPVMAGATFMPVGMLEVWNPSTRVFEIAEVSDVADAATAQGVTAIALDTPSSTFFSMVKEDAGYAVPYYVAPVLNTLTGAAGDVLHEWHQSGALHLGIKIVSMPTDASVTISQMQGALYFMGLARKFESQTTV